VEQLLVFSNEAAESGEPDSTLSVAFEEAALANESEGWYRLATYRDYSHANGTQRVDQASANEIAKNFSGMVSRVKRFFGWDKPPVFIGHPDDPAYPHYADTTAYGSVDKVEARDDGLYAHVTWANEWQDRRTERPWRLSPRWGVRPNSDGSMSPKRLISIGLTDRPNLPDAAYANSQTKEPMNELLKLLLAKLGFAPDRIDATLSGGDNAVKTDEASAAIEKIKTNSAAEKAKADLATANESVEKLKAEKAKAEEAVANERKARAKLVADAAFSNGKIMAADRDSWERKLAEAKDWDAVANELNSAKPAMHTKRQFSDPGARRDPESAAASNEMIAKVKACMAATGQNFEDAWATTSQTAEGEKLLKAMDKKSS
jgi:hypothetical protein